MTTKICTVCAEEKSITDYYKHGKGSKGQTIYKSSCKACYNSKTLDTYNNLSKEEKYERNQINRINLGSDYFKRYRLNAKYGLTLEEYENMLDKQHNMCYICEVEFSTAWRPQVDHNHDTGAVRKLLCKSCNTAIGHMREDVNIMSKAIEYIKEHNTK